MTETVIGDGKYLRLVRRDGWELVERKRVTGIVAIVAVTPDQKLILTEQYRPPVSRRAIDVPAGLAGDIEGAETEELATAAKRELLEETGWDAREMIYLAEGPPSPGLSSEIVTFFRAEGLARVSAGGGDANEKIVVHEVPLHQIDAWCRDREREGLLIDLKLYAGLYLLRPRVG